MILVRSIAYYSGFVACLPCGSGVSEVMKAAGSTQRAVRGARAAVRIDFKLKTIPGCAGTGVNFLGCNHYKNPLEWVITPITMVNDQLLSD